MIIITLSLHFIIYHIYMQDFIYPENVAFPIGGPDDKQYAVIQIHYNNPNEDSGMMFITC